MPVVGTCEMAGNSLAVDKTQGDAHSDDAQKNDSSSPVAHPGDKMVIPERHSR